MSRPPSTIARAKLIRATAELLAEDGMSGMSVEAVARRSGVAKTTLYRHFGGLDGVVFAAVAAGVGEAEGPDTGTLRGDVREILRRYLALARSSTNREVFAWMLARAMQSRESAERFRRGRIHPRGPTVIALQRAMARGEIPPTTDVDLAVHLIQGPLISLRFVEGSEPADSELETLLDMTVRALAGSDGPLPDLGTTRARGAPGERGR